MIEPGFLTFLDAETRARHRARALEAMAWHLCNAEWTDGFCGGQREGCRCRATAEKLLAALEIRGVIPVWEYDRRVTVPVQP